VVTVWSLVRWGDRDRVRFDHGPRGFRRPRRHRRIGNNLRRDHRARPAVRSAAWSTSAASPTASATNSHSHRAGHSVLHLVSKPRSEATTACNARDLPDALHSDQPHAGLRPTTDPGSNRRHRRKRVLEPGPGIQPRGPSAHGLHPGGRVGTSDADRGYRAGFPAPVRSSRSPDDPARPPRQQSRDGTSDIQRWKRGFAGRPIAPANDCD